MIHLPYPKFRYLYPPRAENAVDSENLDEYDNGKFAAQPKLNGDCTVVFTNGTETHVYDRHKKMFKKTIKIAGSFSKLHRETISDTAGCKTGKWMVLVGEHMIKSKRDEKGEVWNEKFVIFDIIVYDGVQLVGKTFKERIELLDSLYGKDDMVLTAGGVENLKFLYTTNVEDVFRVKTFWSCFKGLWNDLVKIDMYEGLVLKMSDAKLENGNSERNNSNSQLKFRKPTKNYKF